MGSGQIEMNHWQERAERLFFEGHRSIVEIEEEIRISRKSISRHLSRHPQYLPERERRKQENLLRRAEYKKDWERKHRPAGRFENPPVTKETIQREHDIAVMILSHEKY